MLFVGWLLAVGFGSSVAIIARPVVVVGLILIFPFKLVFDNEDEVIGAELIVKGREQRLCGSFRRRLDELFQVVVSARAFVVRAYSSSRILMTETLTLCSGLPS